MTGLVIVAIFAIVAVIGPWISPQDPNATTDALLVPPSGAHWLGPDHLGRDIFSQIIVGTRGVMEVGLIAGVVATALAVLIGVSAGSLGGVADEVLSALSNIFLVIPQLPLGPAASRPGASSGSRYCPISPRSSRRASSAR